MRFVPFHVESFRCHLRKYTVRNSHNCEALKTKQFHGTLINCQECKSKHSFHFRQFDNPSQISEMLHFFTKQIYRPDLADCVR
jgi:hypothetical protein